MNEKLITASFVLAGASLLVSFVLIGLEIYVRWNMNRDFSFLGGDSLAALILSSFGFTGALLFVHHKK